MTFGITTDGMTPEYFAYNFQISYPASVMPTAYNNLHNPGGSGLTYTTGLNSAGPLIVDWVLYGQTAFSTDTGNLFTVEFDGLMDDPSAEIQVTVADFRQHAGAGFIYLPVSVGGSSTVVVDGTDPVQLAPTFPGAPNMCLNADFMVTVSGTDNFDLDKVEYCYDGTSWDYTALSVSGTSDGGTFTTMDATAVQGARTIYVRFVDSVCNVSNEFSWTFNVDTLPPVAPTALSATPDHEAVHLTWTEGSDYTGYTLYGKLRVGYPYFNDGSSSNSLPPAAGSFTSADSLTSFNFGDPTEYIHNVMARGVYDYQLKAFDCAPNPSASSNIASSTNYFLGDWASPSGLGTFDGFVCSYDVAQLSVSYGNFSANDLTAHMDVAPTSNNSAFGLPGPDHRINFEDLI
ncbi:MAG: hypothetical protein KDC10_16655, partial [Calditrichaeota bacterium]|nr:hypothetical protein [Calditrichota bacterium]